MRRILAQTRKELMQILRDKRALALALVLPLIQLILMGSAISLTVKDLPTVVQDLDDSPASRQLGRCVPRIEHIPHRSVAGGPAAGRGVHRE